MKLGDIRTVKIPDSDFQLFLVVDKNKNNLLALTRAREYYTEIYDIEEDELKLIDVTYASNQWLRRQNKRS